MAYESKPTGTFKTLCFRVWGLDVWGHAEGDCEEEHGDECASNDGEGPLYPDCDCDRHEQCDGFTVNDRTKLGVIEVRAEGQRWNAGTPHESTTFYPTDKAAIDALIAGGYLTSDCTEETIGLDWELDTSLAVDRKSDGRPLLQLERETLNDETGGVEDSAEYPIHA